MPSTTTLSIDENLAYQLNIGLIDKDETSKIANEVFDIINVIFNESNSNLKAVKLHRYKAMVGTRVKFVLKVNNITQKPINYGAGGLWDSQFASVLDIALQDFGFQFKTCDSTMNGSRYVYSRIRETNSLAVIPVATSM